MASLRHWFNGAGRRAALLGGLLTAGAAWAAEPPELPAPLSEWRGWVREANPKRACVEPLACVWMGPLNVEGQGAGARFWFEARNDARQPLAVRLPGDLARWPARVRVAGALAIIQDKGGEPMVELPANAYSRVEGELELSADSPLPVDARMGWAKLSLGGRQRAQWIQGGALDWAGAGARSKGEGPGQGGGGEKPEARIYRKLSDGQAPILTTRVRIVSDSVRKTVRIEGLLPEGSEPYAISGAKARWESGALAVDIAAGVTLAEVSSRLNPDLKSVFASAKSDDLQLDGREYWFSEPDPRLRRMSMSGTPVDPRSLPPEARWDGLPVYEKSDRSALSVSAKAQEREDRPLSGSSLSELWLDFSGEGSSLRQTLQGQAPEAGALSAGGSWDVRHARVNQEPALVALGAQGGKKIAHPPGEAQIQLFARSGHSWAPVVPASVAGPFQAQSAQIVAHAPPGWRFAGVWGPGSTGDGWAASFSLWDWFLIIVMGWGARRLFGARWALLSTAGFVAGKLFTGAPLEIFLPLLALPAGLRALPDGALRKAAAGAGALCVALALAQLGAHTIGRAQKTLHTSMDDRHQPGARGWFDQARAPGAAPRAASEVALDEPGSLARDGAAMISSAPAAAPAPAQNKEPRAGAQGAAQAGEGEPAWEWLESRVRLGAPASDQARTRLVFIKPWLVKALSALSVLGGWALLLLCAKASFSSWRREGQDKGAA